MQLTPALPSRPVKPGKILWPIGCTGMICIGRKEYITSVGWLFKQRRLTRDYGRHTAHSEAFIYIAMLRLMLNRLVESKQK
jgi:hypothetical protein